MAITYQITHKSGYQYTWTGDLEGLKAHLAANPGSQALPATESQED